MDDDRNVNPGRRLTRAEAKARTRALLLDAAAREFAAHGYAGASVDRIAEAAGFSAGALYANFASKEALFLELLAARGTDRLSRAAQALAGQPRNQPLDLAAVAAQLGTLLVEVADKEMDFAPLQAEFWLYAVRHPEALARLAEQTREPRAELVRLVAVGLTGVGARPEVPAESVATVIQALFGGLVRQRRINPDAVPPELFSQALTWLFTGLRGTRGPDSPDPAGESATPPDPEQS